MNRSKFFGAPQSNWAILIVCHLMALVVVAVGPSVAQGQGKGGGGGGGGGTPAVRFSATIINPSNVPANVSMNAVAMNNMSEIVGTVNLGGSRVFVWSPLAGMRLIDEDLSPEDAAEFQLVVGSAINGQGQITGRMVLRATGESRAFLYTPGATLEDHALIENLGAPFPPTSAGLGLNDFGEVVGRSGSPWQPIYWPLVDNAVALPPLLSDTRVPREAAPSQIGNDGVIVGEHSEGVAKSRAVYWMTRNSFPVAIPYFKVGAQGNYSGWAAAHCDGIIVGSTTAGVVGKGANAYSIGHAFRYDSSTHVLKDLGTLGGDNSVALDVNSTAEIVGFSETKKGDSQMEPFYYTNSTGIVNLKSAITNLPSGSTLSVLAGWTVNINDSGQILVNVNINGVWRPAILTRTQ